MSRKREGCYPRWPWIWQVDSGHHHQLTGYYVWQCDMCTFSQQECDAASCLRHMLQSTDEKPDPKGKECWCFYQKVLAAVDVLGFHRANVGTLLSEEVGAFGHTELLERCLMGKTQNTNDGGGKEKMSEDQLCRPVMCCVCHVCGCVGV